MFGEVFQEGLRIIYSINYKQINSITMVAF